MFNISSDRRSYLFPCLKIHKCVRYNSGAFFYDRVKVEFVIRIVL